MDAVDLYLMSPPAPTWQLRGRANFRSAQASGVDARQAIREWVLLADAIEDRGGRVVCLIPERDTPLTGLPYAAECGQITERDGDYLFVLPNMGVAHRQGERELWRRVAVELGLRPVDVDGVWEAQGDVAWFQGHTFLFYGGRTNRPGAEGAAGYLSEPQVFLEVRQPAFHGNMALLPIESAKKILVCPDVLTSDALTTLGRLVGENTLFRITLEEMRLYATNSLPIGSDILAPHLVPQRIIEAMRGWGLNITVLSMVELCEKGGGASRCLVSQARVNQSAFTIPERYDYRQQRERILTNA